MHAFNVYREGLQRFGLYALHGRAHRYIDSQWCDGELPFWDRLYDRQRQFYHHGICSRDDSRNSNCQPLRFVCHPQQYTHRVLWHGGERFKRRFVQHHHE